MDLLDDESLLDLRRRARPTDAAAVLEEERRLRQAKPQSPASNPDATAGIVSTPREPEPLNLAARQCALCKARPPRDLCVQCGRPACAADLWIMLRLCRTCATDDDVERGQRGARPSQRNWLEGRQ